MAVRFQDVVLHNTYELPLSVLFLIFSLLAIIQAARIVWNRHKLFSYHFVFVILALVWFLMRFTFFFFIGYWRFQIFMSLCIYWFIPLFRTPETLIIRIPVGFQFSTFLLLIHYLSSVYHKVTWESYSKNIAWVWFSCANFIVFGSIAAILGMSYNSVRFQPLDQPPIPFWYLFLVRLQLLRRRVDQYRAMFSAVMFLLLDVLLVLYGFRVQRLLAQNRIPNLHISWFRFTMSLSVIIIIFLTRVIYDLVLFFHLDWALSFIPGNWALDLAVCGIILIWEIVPTALVLLLFWRIQVAPAKVAPVPYSLADSHPARRAIAVNSPLPTSLMFDNPNRYDSDAESETTSLFPNSPNPNSYGGRYGGTGLFSYSSTFSPYRTYSPINPLDTPLNSSIDDPPPNIDKISLSPSRKRKFKTARMPQQMRLFDT